jgi:flagellar biosynthesis protein FlhG
MAEVLPDQASGLRRMFSRGLVRTVTVAAGARGVGRSVLTANLACALARRGAKVCVLDSAERGRGVGDLLGVETRFDLADVLEGRRTLDAALMPGPEGTRFLAADRARPLLPALAAAQQQRVADAFDALESPVDVLLIDSPIGSWEGVSSYSLAAGETLVVVSTEPSSITEAYGLMKRLARDGARRRFHVLVNRVRDVAQAATIFGNLDRLASAQLDVQLELLGALPDDPLLARAVALRQPVVSVFPEAASSAALGAAADAVLQWPYAGEDRLDGFVQRLVRLARDARGGARH